MNCCIITASPRLYPCVILSIVSTSLSLIDPLPTLAKSISSPTITTLSGVLSWGELTAPAAVLAVKFTISVELASYAKDNEEMLLSGTYPLLSALYVRDGVLKKVSTYLFLIHSILRLTFEILERCSHDQHWVNPSEN
jgi:hypothetical protein